MKQGSTALASLRPQEAVQVLAGLTGSHPELVAELENLAAEAIAPPGRDQVEASVSRRLRGLDIDDLAELAGMHRGRYVQPWTAAGELIDGIVGPYLADVRRLAGLGRMAEAHRVAVGVQFRTVKDHARRPQERRPESPAEFGPAHTAPEGVAVSLPRAGVICCPSPL